MTQTKGEKVFIPVVVSVSGMTDLVYNDFYVADGADVTIVAGLRYSQRRLHDSRHDGIHTFHVGKMPTCATKKNIMARETERDSDFNR